MAGTAAAAAAAAAEEEEEVAGWSRDDNKAFENAVAAVAPPEVAGAERGGGGGGGSEEGGGGDGKWWDMIAARVPGKTAAEVRRHYEILVEDVRAIEAGRVPIPRYSGEEAAPPHPPAAGKEGHGHGHGQGQGQGVGEKKGLGFEVGKGCSKSEQERKKGIPWTEEEHRLFLLGLDKFGKGDWRSISRNFVISRTPTQVASHAQKYFIRLNSINRDRRRSSIHDITSVNSGEVSSSPQGPITGQGNGTHPATIRPPMAHQPLPSQPPIPAVGMYGPPLGHPVPGHMISAIGTPVMLPPPGHVPYVVPVAHPVLSPKIHQ
uniref:Transcription factor MYBS1 n=1 Tax=Ananas comosus var. bracteatus TaxID=296719 RepID=A0A6V7PVU7_ANACO|nr:unnamed protein product [Ananas comosus var. bracteatus]